MSTRAIEGFVSRLLCCHDIVGFTKLTTCTNHTQIATSSWDRSVCLWSARTAHRLTHSTARVSRAGRRPSPPTVLLLPPARAPASFGSGTSRPATSFTASRMLRERHRSGAQLGALACVHYRRLRDRRWLGGRYAPIT